MRSFDTWNRYLDNNGNPLHGCVQFMVKDGNTVAPIFDSDGTPLDNPIITDIYGRTVKQVFINEDVIAYFYAYIGNGIWSDQTGIDTSDQSLWYLQYTIENQSDSKFDITSTGLTCIPSISALRALDVDTVPVINGVKAITLLGYNAIGDKEPINYYWDAESTEPDDDGSIIKYNNETTGRWIMVQPTEHCDSRHFGVFPSNSYNMDDQTYGINKLFEYCSNKGLRPFFNGTGDYKWFKYTNINVSAAFIDVSEGTKFYDNGNSTITGEWNGDPSFVNRNTNVVAKNVKTSWTAKSYTGYKNVIIDANSNQTNWQNAHIDTRLNPTFGYNFNNCTFEENRNLGSHNGGNYNTFTNCNLTAKMFITSGNNATSFATGQATNCIFDINDWKGTEEDLYYYIQLRITNDTDPNFDFQSVITNNRPFINYAGSVITSPVIKLTNFFTSADTALTLIRFNSASTLELNNCSGKFNLNNWGAGTTVVIKNCRDLIISNLPNKATMIVEDSTITMQESDTLEAFTMRNSTFLYVEDVELTCHDFTCYESTLSMRINCSNAVIKNSQLNNVVAVTYDDNDATGLYLDNNVLNARVYLLGKYGTTDTHVVNTFITNNNGMVQTPIYVDESHLSAIESEHTYTYEGNYGTFLKKYGKGSGAITLIDDARNFTGTQWTWSLGGGSYGPRMPYISMTSSYYDDGESYTRYKFRFPFTLRLFRIGRDDAPVEMEWDWNYWTAGIRSDSNPYTYWRTVINPFKFKACATYTGTSFTYSFTGLWLGPAPTGSEVTSQSVMVADMNVPNNYDSLGTASFDCSFNVKLI